MNAQRILVLGGSGVLSSACVARAVEVGHEVTVVNRGGSSALRPVPDGVRVVLADVRDPASVRAALAAAGSPDYDVVCQFLAFVPEHVRADLDLFEGHTGHYVFVSSASAYETPPTRLPITEATPLRNPFMAYSRDKIACEALIGEAIRERALPATIVRPSHTYDRTAIPTLGGWTDIARMRAGRPVLVHGDGTTPWTITHHTDFAVGFVGLLGHPGALGEAFHITGDDTPTWDQIYQALAAAAGVPEPELVHVASETIAAIHPDWGPPLLGDKAHARIFDNAKVAALVPEFRTTVRFAEGAREIVAFHDAHPEVQQVDPVAEAAFERILALPRG